MKAINEPIRTSVEFIGMPKKGLIQSRTLMRELFRLAKDNKIRRVLVVFKHEPMKSAIGAGNELIRSLQGDNAVLKQHVEMLLREAVWAMEFVEETGGRHEGTRARAFLANPAVAEWRKREEAR